MKSRFIVLAALLSIFLSACVSLASDITPPPNYQSPTPGPTMSPLFPQSQPSLASGAAIYAEKCAACHGVTGLGDGEMASKLQKPPAAIGRPEIARLAAPANWYTTVTEGNINSFMPPFNASLSDQQRWDVVAYSLSLGGATAAEAQSGQSLYDAQCAQCHGPAGDAVPNANLADQALMAKLTQNDIANFIDKGVGSMPGFGGIIQPADILAISSYVRTFTVVAGQVAAASSPTPEPPAATPTASVSDGTPSATVSADATPVATSTPAELVGTIAGTVTNGSGGALPTALKAVLHTFEHNTETQQFNEVDTQEVALSSDGKYSFTKVAMPSNRAFYVSVNFADADYESEPAFPKDGQVDFDLPITIFETTTDTSALVARQVHLLLDYTKGDVIQVVQFFIITNTGTKTVVAAEKGGPIVTVTLPEGYSNLQFEQGAIGDRYLKTTDGFADTTPIAPGASQYQIVFAMDLPLPKPGLFGGQKFEFTQIFPVKADAASVLLPQGVGMEGDTFKSGGLQDMGSGTQFQVFTSGPVEQGQSLTVKTTGAPQAAGAVVTGTDSTQNIIIGIGAFGLVLILAGVWLFWRDRQRTAQGDLDDEDDEEDDDAAVSATQDEIMDVIVALDDQFKAGNLSEVAYKERRAELKARLKSIL